MEKQENLPDGAELRRLAEAALEASSNEEEDLSAVSPEDKEKLIHELRVHQIELKMQNEELRRVQGELEKARDRYSHLYDFAPVGYFSMNQKGVIDEANLTIASMLGIDRTALIGQPFTRFIPRDDQDTFYKHRQQLFETEAPQSCELRLAKTDGHELYALLECVVITNRGNDFKQIRAAVSDITERKRTEEALRQSEDFLKTLINAIPTPVFYKDRDGKYLGFNNAFEDFFGESKERLIGKSVFDVNPPELAEIYYSRDDELFHNGGVQRYESQWKDAHGELRDFIFNKALFTDSKGNIGGLIGVLLDITDRKRAEKALIESEKKWRNILVNTPQIGIALDPTGQDCLCQ